MSEEEGGRVFFARPRRVPDRLTELVLLSVGIDIGSATTHLVISRLQLQGSGSQTTLRSCAVVFDGDILLTPYAADDSIDTDALGRFFAAQYARADVDPAMIDTGAVILTGLAAARRNAAAIGALFAASAGRFVAVAAGDSLETILSAYGSGAVAASARGRVMNVDIGGGTSKIAVCEAGQVVDFTALDIGARLILLDAAGAVARIEPAGAVLTREAGVVLHVGHVPEPGALEAICAVMARHLFAAAGGMELQEATRALHRLPPVPPGPPPDQLGFSGGVSEYMTGRETGQFGDLGPLLADAVMARMGAWCRSLRFGNAGIRATVLGAAQSTVQVSGSTIHIDPPDILPLRGLAVIAPALPLEAETLDPAAIAAAIIAARRRADLAEDSPAALFYRWSGAATHARLEAFCRGVVRGMAGETLVLIGDGDVAGLVGLQCGHRRVVSIDGVVLRDFDFCDIGAAVDGSGAVPVVIRSLVLR